MRVTLNIKAVIFLKKPTNPDPKIIPPGWAALGKSIGITAAAPQLRQRRQRCHMLPALLGGTNVESQNFFSCHWKTNNPGMKHFETLADYLLRISNAYYEPLAAVATGSSELEYSVSTVPVPRKRYPAVVKIKATQKIGAFTRVAFHVAIQNKLLYTGRIIHQCKPWFDMSSGKRAMGPPAFRQRFLVDVKSGAKPCPHKGKLWVKNM